MRTWLALLVVAAGCRDTAAAHSHDHLVVLLVIDQWPEWAFEQKRPHLQAGGFERLLAEGDWHVGVHPTAVTLTAPGHALLGTGATPATSGIVANEWWHRDLGKEMRSVESLAGTANASWLRVPGLGDSIAAAHTGAKAVSVSLKDRAALLPLGHSGKAIWYSPRTVDWTTNTRTPWLDDWNHRHPIALHLHDVWTPLDPAQLAALTGRRDYQIGEAGEKGFGSTFPHPLDGTKEPADAIFAAPIGNELVLDTALAAIDGEHLGIDDKPDLLIVSLSAHDYIAHGWGHESWEAWDATMRLDRSLATFLDELDRRVGSGRWSMVVTSDHGASHLPELVGGGRLRYAQIEAVANAAASRVLGPGHWIASPKFPTVFLSDEARAHPDRDVAITSIVEALRAQPGVGRAERSADFVGGCQNRAPDARVLCLALDPERSGEVIYLPAAGWVLEDNDEPLATSHGSSHDYDRQVPVLLLAPTRTRHALPTAPSGESVPMEQIAGILAGWLGVTPPSQLH
ncbi:MAG: alkaline phosphatase family protein [Kofleriaceae bacterium]